MAWRYNHGMNQKEKILFHQIHPAKLATDIVSAIVSLYFFWQHELLIGLIAHFVPPPVGSFLVIRFAGLEPYKNSRLGRYLVRYMTPSAQGSRLLALVHNILISIRLGSKAGAASSTVPCPLLADNR